jgi:hypothetical protein
VAQIDAVDEFVAPPEDHQASSSYSIAAEKVTCRVRIDTLRNAVSGLGLPLTVVDVAVRSIGKVSQPIGTTEGVVDLDVCKIVCMLAERCLTNLENDEHRDGCGSGAVTPESEVALDFFVSRLVPRLPLFARKLLFSGGNEDSATAAAVLIKTLRGKILVRKSGSSAACKVHVQWCPHQSLPHVLAARVRRLFDILRQGVPGSTGSALRWDKEELRPFIEPVLDQATTMDAALAKLCREHRKPGEPSAYSLL